MGQNGADKGLEMFARVQAAIGEQLEKKLEEVGVGQGPDHVKAPYGLRATLGSGY